MAYIDEEVVISNEQVVAFNTVTDFTEAAKNIVWKLYSDHADELYKGIIFFFSGIVRKYVEKILTRILGPNPYA